MRLEIVLVGGHGVRIFFQEVEVLGPDEQDLAGERVAAMILEKCIGELEAGFVVAGLVKTVFFCMEPAVTLDFSFLGPSVNESTAMPASFFLDPAVYELEREKIFRQEWIAVATQYLAADTSDR